MKNPAFLFPVLALSVAGALPAAAQTADETPRDDAIFHDMVDSYCTDCHNAEDWAGGVAFDLMEADAVTHDAEVWETAARKLRGRLMPPPGSEQPEQARIDRFVAWLEDNLDQGASLPRAGHVPVQRLNRSEYERAVKDLLGVEIDAEDYLPTDIEVDGFDNIAAALSVSPAFLDQYINAARAAARLAVGNPVAQASNSYYPSPGGLQGEFEDGMPPGSRGGMAFTHHFPADGEYSFNILDLDVGLYPRGLETRHTLVLLVDDREVFRGDIGGPEDLALADREGPAGHQKIMSRFNDITAQVEAGAHEVVVTFLERSRAESDLFAGASGGFGAVRLPRVLDGIEVVGPHHVTGIANTDSRAKIFVCQPEGADEEPACAQQIIRHLAGKAFRRPITDADVADLMPFFEQGRRNAGGFDAGIEYVVAAVLASPDFMYRGISTNKDIGDNQVFALNDLELATRLSFFLWGQGPDEDLLETAAAGELQHREGVEAQVRRMLSDPRADNLVNNFALKWLNLDDLDEVEPEPARFPGFNDRLREDFTEEMRRFMASILLEDRPVVELLTADHTYLNERLARHYGINDVYGAQFRRVTLEDEARWGLLGKSAVLLRTSYGDRTSPVLRGAWVLEKIMGTPPAPPPPNVETDLAAPEGAEPSTLRARLEQHRANPSCNQCHGVIDPLGLALENFDVTGQWRDEDREAGQPINARTVLPTGVAIEGPAELRRELAGRPDQFARALTEKLMMFALGRELEYFDMPQVRAIVRAAQQRDYRLSAIVLGIVNSDAFRRQALPHGEEGNVQMAGLDQEPDAANDN